MTVFAGLIDALFVDPNLGIDAFYQVGGAARTIDAGTYLTGDEVSMDFGTYQSGVSSLDGGTYLVPVRVVMRRPDRIGDFGDTRIVSETTVIDVRVADVAMPAEGDTFDIDGSIYIIQGEPVRDMERLIWTAEVRPA